MIFFQGTFLASMGAAGAIVVGIAVLYGLTFLPAVLSVLGERVDWPAWMRRRLAARKPPGTGAWHSMAVWVMRRAWFGVVPAVGGPVLGGTALLQLRVGHGGVGPAPPRNPRLPGYDE